MFYSFVGLGWMKANGNNLKIGHLSCHYHLPHVIRIFSGPQITIILVPHLCSPRVFPSQAPLKWSFSLLPHVSMPGARVPLCLFFLFPHLPPHWKAHRTILGYLRATQTMSFQMELPKAFTPVWPQTQRMTLISSHTPSKALRTFGNQEMMTEKTKWFFTANRASWETVSAAAAAATPFIWTSLNQRETERKISSRQRCHVSRQ